MSHNRPACQCDSRVGRRELSFSNFLLFAFDSSAFSSGELWPCVASSTVWLWGMVTVERSSGRICVALVASDGRISRTVRGDLEVEDHSCHI